MTIDNFDQNKNKVIDEVRELCARFPLYEDF